MKKISLRVLGLVGVLTFILSMVGYCDGESCEKRSSVLEENKRNSELFCAAEMGDLEKAKTLVKNGANVNFVHVNSGVGPYSETSVLEAACWNGNLEITKLLIERGANVNFVAFGGCTPLSYTCSRGHLDIVELLIEKGANVNAGNFGGKTPLAWACANGNLAIVKLLLEKGADVNLQCEGATPLHSAAEYGNYEIAKLLVEKGANVNANNNGITPLARAIIGFHKKGYMQNSYYVGDFILGPEYNDGHVKIIQLLKDNGAKVSKDKVVEECKLLFNMLIIESYEEKVGRKEKINVWE